MTLCCDPHVKSPNINQISQKKIDRISSKIYLVMMGKGLDCYSRVPYLLFLYNHLDKNYSQMKKKPFILQILVSCVPVLTASCLSKVIVTGSKDQKNVPLVSHLLNFLSLLLVILLGFFFQSFFKVLLKL